MPTCRSTKASLLVSSSAADESLFVGGRRKMIMTPMPMTLTTTTRGSTENIARVGHKKVTQAAKRRSPPPPRPSIGRRRGRAFARARSRQSGGGPGDGGGCRRCGCHHPLMWLLCCLVVVVASKAIVLFRFYWEEMKKKKKQKRERERRIGWLKRMNESIAADNSFHQTHVQFHVPRWRGRGHHR
jgi:hypothetical protein